MTERQMFYKVGDLVDFYGHPEKDEILEVIHRRLDAIETHNKMQRKPGKAKQYERRKLRKECQEKILDLLKKEPTIKGLSARELQEYTQCTEPTPQEFLGYILSMDELEVVGKTEKNYNIYGLKQKYKNDVVI
jgi:hypothetical protein